MLFSLNIVLKGTLLSVLKEMTMKCVKTYNFKIKVRNVLMVYFEIYVLL